MSPPQADIPNLSTNHIPMTLKRELIYIDEKDVTDSIETYTFHDGLYRIVFKNDAKPYSYSQKRIQIVKTAVSKDEAFRVFQYLRETASIVGLKTEQGDNTLEK